MPPLVPSPASPTPLAPWEARVEWQEAALLVAMVVAPEALQVVEGHVERGRAGLRPRLTDPAPLRSRRVGRRPGVRPPRSC